jgi:deoxycytidylate deaminase
LRFGVRNHTRKSSRFVNRLLPTFRSPFRAISARLSGLSLSRRALLPERSGCPGHSPESPVSFSISPVRILATRNRVDDGVSGSFGIASLHRCLTSSTKKWAGLNPEGIPSMALTEWDRRYLHIAQQVSCWSKDPSTKVGAVIADSPGRVVALGYNGRSRTLKLNWPLET